MKNITLVIVGRDQALTSPNLGVCYLASYLREKGFGVQLVDEVSGENIFDKVKNTDIVGLSSSTGFMNRALLLAKQIKDKYHVPIVIGGPHASALPELTLENPNIDYVVIGEGEIPLTELMEGKDPHDIKALGFKEKGELIINKGFNLIPQENMDTIPFPARDLLNMDFYFKKKDSFQGFALTNIPIMTSRGCPYNCSYCSGKVTRGRGMRFHSADYVIKEIQDIMEIYHPQSLSFWDDLLLTNKKRLFEICDKMIELGIHKKIIWSCYARADSIDDDTLKKIKDAGCIQIEIGFESGSPKILGYLKCNTTTVEQNKNAVEMCKKIGIRIVGFFMLGNPNETMEDLNKTIDFMRSNPIDFTTMSTTTPYPGTPLWEDWIKMYNIDLNKLDWDEFWHGKGTFFVEDSMKEEFDKAWKTIRMEMSLRNYRGSPLLLFKRFLMRPGNAVKILVSYIKEKL